MEDADLILSGEFVSTGSRIEVANPYTEEIYCRVSEADDDIIAKALAGAAKASKTPLESHERKTILRNTAELLLKKKDELAKCITSESGKPMKASLWEVDRAALTFDLAADMTTQPTGEIIPSDVVPGMANRWCLVKRYPIGPVLAIAPFNFPLNLVVHKVAPALAAGNPFIVKPSSLTPKTSLLLGKTMLDAGLPKEYISVLPCKGRNANKLVADERIKLLTFTGSSDVGWMLKSKAGKKGVTLELGGNAPAVILNDADLELAADRCTYGAFSYSGQVCVKTQRLIVEKGVYEEFKALFLDKVRKLKVGDPMNIETDVGPMIDRLNIQRVKKWVDSAAAKGADVLVGNEVKGTLSMPTVVENVPRDEPLYFDEIFGPVAVLEKTEDFEEAITLANDTKYGLQAGFFSRNVSRCMEAADRMVYGGVMINEVPTYRIDNMPFGGTKYSGIGREGLKYAVEEMTEIKTIVLTKTE